MSKTHWQGLMKVLERTFVKRGPEILTGMGIGGMVTTTVLAVKATPEALRRLDAKKKQEDRDELTLMETIKTAGVCYIPATVTGMLSITCLICASSVNHRRNAALATAYSLSETALSEYRAKVVETMGEKKDQSIRDEIAKDHIARQPVNSCSVIVTNDGDFLCYDKLSGRYFRSNLNKLQAAENEINRRMISEMYISVNELYYELHLPSIPIGDTIGWNMDKGFLKIFKSYQPDENGTPCCILDYDVAPEYKYH